MTAIFGDRPLLILFMFPIILCAAFGGFGPGLVSTLVAALSIAYYIIPPAGGFEADRTHDFFQLGFLVADGLLVSFLSKMI